MQGQFKFRMSMVALGVLAALGSGQAMAVEATYINGSGTATVPNTLYTNNGGSSYYYQGTTSTPTATANELNTIGTTETGVGNSTGATTITGSTVSITGTTSINTTGTLGTTIGATGNTTSINSSTINVGTGAFTTTVAVGSTQTETTVTATGGNSTLSLVNGTASLTSGTSGLTTTSTATTVVGTNLVNGNAASRALVDGALVVNTIQGNTLVDGNMYINGTLVYSSNTAATTTVTGTNTVGGMSVVNAGQTGVSVDANGKFTTGTTTTQATAALTVTNSLGNTHGIVVQEDKTTISGGTRSSSLTMADNGATFSDSATGAPVQVHGVNDGTSDFDAVNVRQFASAIASVTAMANIPQVDQDKTVSVGMALGSFMGKTALAAGVTYRFTKNGVLKGSVSSAMNSSNSTAVGVGAAWSY